MGILRLSLRQLQIFCAVAQSGSTAAAANQIALSQSATSAALIELERLLSMRLFDRAGKRLILNENGRALIPRAHALLDGAAEIEEMSRSAKLQAQSLRIGASTTIGNYVLPKILSQFLNQHQQTKATSWQSSVMIGNTEKIVAAVAAFDLDIGLIEGPCHEANLAITPWIQDYFVIVGAKIDGIKSTTFLRDIDLMSSQKISLKTLREQMWLLRESGSGTRESTDQLLLPHLRSYHRSIELGSSEAIKHAVEQGLGIACLSRWVANDSIENGRLVCLPTSLPILKRQSYIVIHRDKVQTQTLKQFLKLLQTD